MSQGCLPELKLGRNTTTNRHEPPTTRAHDASAGLNDKLLFEATGRRTGGRGLSKGKAVEMEDIKFHQCVRLARFENDRTISFIPPDGPFEPRRILDAPVRHPRARSTTDTHNGEHPRPFG